MRQTLVKKVQLDGIQVKMRLIKLLKLQEGKKLPKIEQLNGKVDVIVQMFEWKKSQKIFNKKLSDCTGIFFNTNYLKSLKINIRLEGLNKNQTSRLVKKRSDFKNSRSRVM